MAAVHGGLYQTIKATAEGFISDYTTASKDLNPKALSAHLTEDCQRYVGAEPWLASVGKPADFHLDNKGYEDLFEKDMYTWTCTGVNIFYLTVDAQNLKAAATTTYQIKMKDGTPFNRHIAWFVDLTEDGRKIKRTYQLNDASEAQKFREKVLSLQAASA